MVAISIIIINPHFVSGLFLAFGHKTLVRVRPNKVDLLDVTLVCVDV